MALQTCILRGGEVVRWRYDEIPKGDVHTFGFEIVIAVFHNTQRWILLKLRGPLCDEPQGTFPDFIMGRLLCHQYPILATQKKAKEAYTIGNELLEPLSKRTRGNFSIHTHTAVL